MSIGNPTARAFRFVIDGENQKYDAYADVVKYGDDWYALDVRYRAQGATADKWTYLFAADLPSEPPKDEQSAASSMNKAIDEINEKIKSVFRSGEEKPLSGYELFYWLVSYGMQENNNVISLK